MELKKMVDLLRKNKINVFIIVDILCVVVSGLLALLFRFDFAIDKIPYEYMHKYLILLPADIAVTVAVFWFCKLYHQVWTFFSFNNVRKIFESCFMIACLEISYKIMLQMNMPRSYYILSVLFMAFFASVSRMSVRMTVYNINEKKNADNKINTLLIGAGEAGNTLMNEFVFNKTCRNRIVSIIDDNPYKKGKYLNGVLICGGREMIAREVKEKQIEEIIVAIPSAGAEKISEMAELALKTDCRVRILPEVATTLRGNIAGAIRNADVHDLIGREQIDVNSEGIREFLEGKTVLVTGGGGSIGSELCRQIMSNKPGKLIIFDIYENNAYTLQKELEAKYGRKIKENIVVLIGSVRDYDRMEEVFRLYRPHIVYHAAAHKHVPLMEDSPCEAVKNNCLGTLNVCRLADKYKAESFILISTDKAVRPTNIMGATKRICEMIIQNFAARSDTRFVAVRFGNVLGSNGSVVPLFISQIEAGGPVTVTHKDITRFFMTIPEAVSLILQAGIFGAGGEIFVLNMGKPVKIYELAESLIRQKGYRPNQDIKIEIVGLRPGEKLYEEVLMDEEGLKTTDNNLIFIGSPIAFDRDEFDKDLSTLIAAAEENDETIKEKAAQLCGSYTITDNRESGY